MAGAKEADLTWLCEHCHATRMSLRERACWNCQNPRRDLRPIGMMSRWFRDSSDFTFPQRSDFTFPQRLHATGGSSLDNERLGKIEASITQPRLKRPLAALDLDNGPRAKTEASTATPRMSPATAISVRGKERRDSIEPAKAKREVSYIVQELIRNCTRSLTSKGLTWNDEIFENASSVLSSSLNTFANKICKSGSRIDLLAAAFILEYRL